MCPGCGVVIAKARAPIGRRQRDAVAEAPASSFSWFGALGLAVALLATAVFIKRQRAAQPPVEPQVSVTTATELAVPSGLLPSLPERATVASLPADSGRTSPEDVRRATALMERVNQHALLTAPDVALAEELLVRYPGEQPLCALAEAVFVESARQEAKRRQYPAAALRLRRAAALRPESQTPWLGLIEVLGESGDWPGVESAARGLLGVNARSPAGLRALGYALVRQDRNREAIEAFEQAQAIEEDASARALLARLRKGAQDEKGMTERHLAHFNVRYDGDEHEAVGREILRALERHYATLAATLDHQPEVSVPVILFTRQAYYDASGAPAWSGGVYDGSDGRIRIPIGGLTPSLTPDMDETLIHELTHAFVADRTHGLAPRELQEGYAQYMEGKRTESLLTKQQMVWLADGRIGGVSGFYLAALSFVEYLMATRGQGGMNELLKAIGESGSVDAAFRDVHGQDSAATRRKWAERLRQQY